MKQKLKKQYRKHVNISPGHKHYDWFTARGFEGKNIHVPKYWSATTRIISGHDWSTKLNIQVWRELVNMGYAGHLITVRRRVYRRGIPWFAVQEASQ